MEDIKKQQIVNALRNYCERYESQAKAANSLKNVSAATVSQMLNGKWELIKDDMWRNVAAQIGWKEEKWNAVATRDFTTLMRILEDVPENALVMAVTGDAGSGKTFALKQYTNAHKQTYLLCCNEYWNRKAFLNELMQAMGRDAAGLSVNEMMLNAVRYLKMQEAPLLILDEADKLSDKVLYFFISLYNALEGECGLLMVATSHLELRIRKGVKANRKGYNEIWSRVGRKCVTLKGVSAADITAVCEANGVTDPRDIDIVINDSESDLRRVRRKIHAILKGKEAAK